MAGLVLRFLNWRLLLLTFLQDLGFSLAFSPPGLNSFSVEWISEIQSPQVSSFKSCRRATALRAEKAASSVSSETLRPSFSREQALDHICQLRDKKFFVYDNEEEPWKPNNRLGVRAPMPVPPKGTVVLPDFDFPQFVDLHSSIAYRRRLRRRRRYHGWNFQDISPLRKFFGARRNHRDQMMHALLSRQSAEARRCSRAWNSRSWMASRKLFGKVAGDSATSAVQTPAEEASVCVQSSVAEFVHATKSSGLPCSVESAKSFLRNMPSFDKLAPLPLRDLECIYTALRSALVTLLLATAPPKVLARELAVGFELPPTCLAAMADPFQSIPGKKMHAWRGYRRWRGMKSRRFDWQNATRIVPPCVAGVSLPRIGSDLLHFIWKRRRDQLRDALLALKNASSDEQTSSVSEEGKRKFLSFARDVPPPAVPPWLESEEVRVGELLVCGVVKKRSDGTTSGTKDGVFQEEEAPDVEGAAFARRALSAAVDVRLWLRCAKAAKKKGHLSAYSWETPFVKARDASPRRRRRLAALPPPGQRQKTRRERIKVNLEKRLQRKKEQEMQSMQLRQKEEEDASILANTESPTP